MRKIVSWIIIVSIVGMSFAWVNILTFEGVRMSVDRLSDGNFVTVGYSNLYVFSTIQGDIIETSGDLFTVFNDTDTTDSDIFPALSAFPDEGFVYLYYHSDSSRFVVRKRSNTGGPMWSPCYFPSDESAPGVDENIYFLKDIYALTDGGCFYAGGGRLVDENQWDAMIGYIDSDGLDQWTTTIEISSDTTRHDIILTIQPYGTEFIAAGASYLADFEYAYPFILHFDADGIPGEIWRDTVGVYCYEIPQGFSAVNDAENILAGVYTELGSYFCIFSPTGEIILRKNFNIEVDSLVPACSAPADDGFVLAGIANQVSHTSVWISKMNNSGEFIWERKYLDSDFSLIFDIERVDSEYIATGCISTNPVIMLLTEDGDTSASFVFESKANRIDNITVNIEPNPFNSFCQIKVDVAETGIIEIFNIRGEKVEQFPLRKGNNSFIWSPENISSGIYKGKITTVSSQGYFNLLYLK